MNASELARALSGATENDDAPKQSPDMQARRLLDSYEDLQKQYSFSPGDLVELKPGLGYYQTGPKHGQPCIVTEIIDPPMIDNNQDSTSPLFGVQHDLRVMLITRTGRCVEFAFDGRLFRPYSGEVA